MSSHRPSHPSGETGKASERDLPAQVMVYYAIALALYMGSSTREVLRCLLCQRPMDPPQKWAANNPHSVALPGAGRARVC